MLCKISLAQDHSAKSKHYISSSYLNPSYIGDCYGIKVSTIQYNKWVGIKNAPSLSAININNGFHGNFGLGLYYIKNTNGFTSRNSFQASFGYHINLFPPYSFNTSKISFGLAYVGNQYVLDESEFSDKADPSISGNIISSYSSNFNLGMKYNFNTFKFGVSILNVVNEKNDLISGVGKNKLPRFINAEIANSFKIKYFKVKPFAVYTYNTNKQNYLDLGIKVTSSPYGVDKFEYSVIHKSEYSNSKYLNSAIIGLIEYKYKNYGIGYAYEHGFDNLSSFSGRTHEIILRFQYPTFKKCKCEE